MHFALRMWYAGCVCVYLFVCLFYLFLFVFVCLFVSFFLSFFLDFFLSFFLSFFVCVCRQNNEATSMRILSSLWCTALFWAALFGCLKFSQKWDFNVGSRLEQWYTIVSSFQKNKVVPVNWQCWYTIVSNVFSCIFFCSCFVSLCCSFVFFFLYLILFKIVFLFFWFKKKEPTKFLIEWFRMDYHQMVSHHISSHVIICPTSHGITFYICFRVHHMSSCFIAFSSYFSTMNWG